MHHKTLCLIIPLKTDIYLNYIQNISAYLTENKSICFIKTHWSMTCGDIVDIDRITQDTYTLRQNAKFHKVARSGG